MKCAILLISLAAAVSAGHINSHPIVGAINGDGLVDRYWDCCKPTCTKANSCAKDGTTIIEPTTPSACARGGGDAYACSNNAPWAANSTVGYAFAKSVFNNIDVPCCSCFNVVLKGKNAGKSLIVQVLLTETTKGKNRFELLIPGSGNGVFDVGCDTQWGAGEDGWGGIFGVDNKAQCLSLLPKDLQNGCAFRFDFLKDISLEQATYTQITCPKELVSKSGCSA